MSRRVLLASFLLLPALASCTDDPEPPPADLRFDGAGLDDDGLWYLPGHAGELIVWSIDERRPAWRFEGNGALAVTTTVHGDSGSTGLTQAAAEPGDGTVTLLDDADQPLATFAAHVTYPDRMTVTGQLGGGDLVISDELLMLHPAGATLTVGYQSGSHVLAGSGLVVGDEHAIAFHGDRSDGIQLWSDAEPYFTTIAAGPDARRTLRVAPILARDVIFEVSTDELSRTAGDAASVYRFATHNESGKAVFHGGERWFLGGVEIEPLPWYTYDPTAAPQLLEVRIGPADAPIVARTTIHAAP